ncbi:hypothetical protein RQM65_06755 [Pricia sp. S334]|uniref:Endonuclease/exonuclease/phosphatase family protein n=1 Tax=Pricia mediterranea TaxID=3076079 RepID=A0ABU3L4P8_9FLAO|nr:hypothetical protein [Pricia sp. S334]MDT7828358.1 hypothetical protein [Pricia sp. S334]
MKIATFNIQNLFHRHTELLQETHSKNSGDWVAQLDSLLRKQPKSQGDNERIHELTFLLGFDSTQNLPYALLKNKGGDLFFKKQGILSETKASFLSDWEGWVKLMNRPLHEKAIFSKAYVIAETDPDILVLQEVEDRSSLLEFNAEFLPLLKISPYEEVMVFETNDQRGLGMGVMLKNGFRMCSLRSYLNERDSEGFNLFDLDCQEYEIAMPRGERVHILSNHFSSDSRQRKEQAEWVAARYREMLTEGKKNILICGALNDVSYSDCLSPLLRETELSDIARHDRFKTDTDKGRGGGYFRLGAYRMGVNIKQKDYLLLPPGLSEKVRSAGMNRKGTWLNRKPNWSLYPSIASKHHAASEHPLVWARIHV